MCCGKSTVISEALKKLLPSGVGKQYQIVHILAARQEKRLPVWRRAEEKDAVFLDPDVEHRGAGTRDLGHDRRRAVARLAGSPDGAFRRPVGDALCPRWSGL